MYQRPVRAGLVLPLALTAGLLAFGSSRVVKRYRLRADSGWPGWLTPMGLLWETWRGMDWTLTLAWLAWIWLLWAAASRRYN
jgi:hypothetical protein